MGSMKENWQTVFDLWADVYDAWFAAVVTTTLTVIETITPAKDGR